MNGFIFILSYTQSLQTNLYDTNVHSSLLDVFFFCHINIYFLYCVKGKELDFFVWCVLCCCCYCWWFLKYVCASMINGCSFHSPFIVYPFFYYYFFIFCFFSREHQQQHQNIQQQPKRLTKPLYCENWSVAFLCFDVCLFFFKN